MKIDFFLFFCPGLSKLFAITNTQTTHFQTYTHWDNILMLATKPHHQPLMWFYITLGKCMNLLRFSNPWTLLSLTSQNIIGMCCTGFEIYIICTMLLQEGCVVSHITQDNRKWKWKISIYIHTPIWWMISGMYHHHL